eukprot:scaffold5928_cov115-Skeletonema_dohrnii-CCMP3373.AAC.2
MIVVTCEVHDSRYMSSFITQQSPLPTPSIDWLSSLRSARQQQQQLAAQTPPAAATSPPPTHTPPPNGCCCCCCWWSWRSVIWRMSVEFGLENATINNNNNHEQQQHAERSRGKLMDKSEFDR